MDRRAAFDFIWSPECNLSTNARAVLSALLKHANADTLRCFPSMGRIANATGLNKRTVQRVMQEIEALGAVESTIVQGGRYGQHREYLLSPSNWCQGVTGDTESLVTESHGTGDTESPPLVTESHPNHAIRTKPLTDESASVLWPIFVEAMDGARLQLTSGRKKQLQLLHREQLVEHDDPLALFRAILAAVKASAHHMSDRAYQVPESLFRNAERRERWALKGRDILAGTGNGNGKHETRDPLMFTSAELRNR